MNTTYSELKESKPQNRYMSKERQSNIELLRAIAMFLVLWVHANFYSIGEPSYSDVLSKPLDSSLKIIFEAICISAVNIFVMISGWFGIHAKVKDYAHSCFNVCSLP